jgi:hypothetical protein
MQPRTKNLIEELDRLVSEKDKHLIVEARASHIIASAMNLVQLIEDSFAEEESEELTKRLLSAIKNKDPDKFNRKIREFRKIEEQRKNVRKL